MKKNRRWLFLLLAAGLIALGAGGGTFASFNAQTTNPGNYFATGSLYLADSASATTCYSYGPGSSNNANPNDCASVLTSAGNAPGTSTSGGNIVLTNTGSIPASSLAVSDSSACNDTAYTVNVANVTVTNGTPSTLTYTGDLITAYAISGNMYVAGAGLTSQPNVTSVSYSSGTSTVTLSGGSVTTESPETVTFTANTASNASGNPLCGDVVASLYDSSSSQCLWGVGITNGAPASGACPSMTGIATSGNPADLTNFTTYLQTPGITENHADASSFTGIAAGGSEDLTLTLYFPDNATAGGDNTLMNLMSNFSITWTITQ